MAITPADRELAEILRLARLQAKQLSEALKTADKLRIKIESQARQLIELKRRQQNSTMPKLPPGTPTLGSFARASMQKKATSMK